MRELTVILCCTWKFAATFPVAIYILRMSFTETLVFTNIGGILGTFVFSVFSKLLIRLWEIYWPERFKISKHRKKVFSGKSRRMVRIKMKYGLPGIVILTPIILSIPVGAFLVSKYFGSKFINYLWLISGLFGWSVIYTVFYFQMMTLI